MAGEKRYSGKKNLTWLKRRHIEDVIASKTNEQRDLDFDKAKYCRRNVVERAIGWPNEKRSITARYENKIRHYLAVVKTGIIRWLLK